MSLYGVMRTGVSGMNAQSNKLGTIADNVSNAGTVGYKRATADFSSFVLDAGNTNYDSGAVVTKIHHAVGEQGDSAYSEKPSVVTYDNLGNQVTLDVYMTKTAADTWQVAAYNHADAPSSGQFPYASAALTTQTMTFDSQGKLSSSPSMSVA